MHFGKVFTYLNGDYVVLSLSLLSFYVSNIQASNASCRLLFVFNLNCLVCSVQYMLLIIELWILQNKYFRDMG